MRVKEDFEETLGLLWEACLLVNGEDLRDDVEVWFQGKKVTMPAVEARLWFYFNNGYFVQLAFDGTELCGILVYGWIFDGIASVRMLYTPKAYQTSRVGLTLVRSVKDLRHVIFQTYKAIEPKQFLASLKGRNRKIAEDDRMVTWEMAMGEENGRSE